MDALWTWITTDALGMMISGGVAVTAITAAGVGVRKLIFKSEPPQPIIVPTTDAQTAKELGVTEAALRNFFKILQEQHVGPDELDAKLRDIAQQHKDLLERVAAIPDVDERTNTLRDDAQAAIADGRYADADAILHDAENQDLQAVAELQDQLNTRKMAAAASAYARGELAFTQLKYQDAATHFLRAAENTPDSEPRSQIKALNMAGRAYHEVAAFQQAETAYTQARATTKAQMGANDPLTAMVLNNLAQLYQDTNRLDEAEPLKARVVSIVKKAYGEDHPKVAIALNNLATLYQATNRMEEAEPLMVRVVSIFEKAYGEDHSMVASALNNLAQLYQDTNRMEEAGPLMQRALAIDEKAFGAEHPNVAIRLNNLAGLYRETDRRKEAEPLLVRAVKIFTASLGAEHPNTKLMAGNLDFLRQEMAARGD